MSLLIEIDADGPRPLACLTCFQLVVQALAEAGLSLVNPWEVVHPVPRHPDWGGPCRLVIANRGALIATQSPPQLVRTIEAHCRKALPDYTISIHPAFDPNLLLPGSSSKPRRDATLPPGELHQLLTARE